MRRFTVDRICGVYFVVVDFRRQPLAGDIARMKLTRAVQCAMFYNSDCNRPEVYRSTPSKLQYALIALPAWATISAIIGALTILINHIQ